MTGGEKKSRKGGWATAGGFGAILLWSTTVAIARSLSERLGGLTAAAAVCTVGGLIALAGLLVRRRRREQIEQLPLNYLIGCGGLFTAYMVLLFLALATAADRTQVLEIALLNYLWPALTLLLSVFLLDKRAGPLFVPATMLALAGVYLVPTQGENLSPQSVLGNFAANPLAYSLGTAAAITWALYSVLTRKWAGGRESGAVDLFLPATAFLLLPACAFAGEERAWSVRSIAEAVLLGAATFLAYTLWDNAMRRGNLVLVTAGSYLTPLLSTLVTCLYLEVTAGLDLWLGCVLLIMGSSLSWLSVSDRRQQEPKSRRRV